MRNAFIGRISGLAAFGAAALASFPAPAAENNCPPVKVMADVDMITAENGTWAIPATVVDQQKIFIVSTGSIRSELSRSVVEELGLPMGLAGFEAFDVAGNVIRPGLVRPPSVLIGRLRGESLPFIVGDSGGADGVLAPDILRNYGVEIDFTGKKFRLIDPNHCAGHGVHWGAAAVAVLPMRIAPGTGHITVPVTVDGVKFDAQVATAMRDTTINAMLAKRRLNVDVNAPDVEEAGELNTATFSAKIYRKRFKAIDLGGLVLTNPVLNIMPDLLDRKIDKTPQIGSMIYKSEEASRLPDVLLGASVLNRLHVYISYRERKLYLTPAGTPAAAPPQ